MTLEQTLLLSQWGAALAQLPDAKAIVENELKLRKETMAAFFPAPVEGVNTLDLEQGWELKATYKIDRKIDEAALPAVTLELRAMGVNADTLIRRKPELETKNYKMLVQTNPIAAKIFDQAMTSKPASPVLELKAPK